jgi:hypothetical protein
MRPTIWQNRWNLHLKILWTLTQTELAIQRTRFMDCFVLEVKLYFLTQLCFMKLSWDSHNGVWSQQVFSRRWVPIVLNVPPFAEMLSFIHSLCPYITRLRMVRIYTLHNIKLPGCVLMKDKPIWHISLLANSWHSFSLNTSGSGISLYQYFFPFCTLSTVCF